MSKWGKLRFQNLPGAEEAKAITGLFQKEDQQIKICDVNQAAAVINNAIVSAWSNDIKVRLILSESLRKAIMQQAKLTGLNWICLDFVNIPTLRSQLLAIQQAKGTASDKSPSWKHLYRRIEQLSYGDFVASHGAMGEKPLYVLIENLIDLKSEDDIYMKINWPSTENFDFVANEYWHFRGRINQASFLFNPSFTKLDELTKLNRVFFDMYRPEEAQAVVEKVSSDLVKKLDHLIKDYTSWLNSYKQAYLSHVSSFLSTLREQAFLLALDLEDHLSSDDEQEVSKGWLNLNPTSSLREETWSSILAAYNDLRHKCETEGIDHLTDLTPTQSPEEVLAQLQDFMKRSHIVRRSIKTQCDKHLNKLNLHNLKIESAQNMLDHLQNDIRSFIDELNGLQLYSEHFEDNTLNISDQILWLRSIERKLVQLHSESNVAEAFVRWQQFRAIISDDDFKIIEALVPFDQSNWVHSFDIWYLQNFIECQDLSSVDANGLIKECLKTIRYLPEKQWEDMLLDVSLKLKDRLNDVLRRNKKLRAWIQESGPVDLSEIDLLKSNLFQDLPIHFDTDDLAGSEVWTISDLNLEFNEVTLRLNLEDGSMDSLDEEEIKMNAIHSDHTDRMHDLKKVVRIMDHHFSDYEIWQNNQNVFVSFMGRPTNDYLFQYLDDSYYRSIISKDEDTDVVLETLINHKGRAFTALFGHETSWNKSSWAEQLSKLKIIGILNNAGFNISYISWSAIFKNAEIMAFLKGKSKPLEKIKSISA